MPLTTPTPVPPSLDRIYAAMLADLKTYAAACASTAIISRDPEDAMLQVINTKGGSRIVLHPEKGDANDRDIQATVELHTFRLFVATHIGIVPGDRDNGICQSGSGAAPLMRQIDDLRLRVLCWRFDSSVIHQGRIYYNGFDPLYTPDGYPIAAYALAFRFRAPIRAPVAADQHIAIAIPEETPETEDGE